MLLDFLTLCSEMYFADYLSRMIRPDGSLLPEIEQRAFLDTMCECQAIRDHFRMPHFDLVDYSDVPVPRVEVDTIQEIDITPLGAPR